MTGWITGYRRAAGREGKDLLLSFDSTPTHPSAGRVDEEAGYEEERRIGSERVRETGTREIERSVGRNEDKGGPAASGDSELSFRSIIHVVCQANGRAGKLAGARNIAFSSASLPKRGKRDVCFFSGSYVPTV